MADDHRTLDAQRLQQRVRVVGQLAERELVAARLARLAEADLVDGDPAKARACERGDRRLPGCRAEVPALQNHHRSTVALGGGGAVQNGGGSCRDGGLTY